LWSTPLAAPNRDRAFAADARLGTIERRFAAVGIKSTPEHRRANRDLLFKYRRSANRIPPAGKPWWLWLAGVGAMPFLCMLMNRGHRGLASFTLKIALNV